MPSEQPRSVDRWLEAYARQRKSAAGTLRDLPAAARQTLHAEITRQYPPVAEPVFSRWITLWPWWPRLAWGGAVLGVLALAAILLFPALRGKTRPQEVAQLPASAGSVPMKATPTTELTPPVQPSLPAADQKIGLAMDKVRSGATSPPSRQSNALAAPSLAGLAGYGVAEPIRLRFTSSSQSVAFEKQKTSPSRLVQARAESATRSAKPPAAARGGGSADGQLKAKTASPPAFSVLQLFDWEQQGDRLRLIDADGSVYSGSISNQPPASSAGVGQVETKPMISASREFRPTPPNRLNNQAEAQPSLAPDRFITPHASALQPIFNFSVSGANHTLGQKVEIRGQLFVDAEAPAPSGGRAAGAKKDGGGTNAVRWLKQVQADNSRLFLQGQAAVGPTNRVLIQATPLGPDKSYFPASITPARQIQNQLPE